MLWFSLPSVIMHISQGARRCKNLVFILSNPCTKVQPQNDPLHACRHLVVLRNITLWFIYSIYEEPSYYSVSSGINQFNLFMIWLKYNHSLDKFRNIPRLSAADVADISHIIPSCSHGYATYRRGAPERQPREGGFKQCRSPCTLHSLCSSEASVYCKLSPHLPAHYKYQRVETASLEQHSWTVWTAMV